ncbi:HAMP domain-containing sensor histidine kinase [Quadrisphaera sp. DSM 44207]|uniref:sensor histidine kinase n=1 Tax=Quadrisphaera sp. DSM 44207 TaxID=1881057 RepID=UPI00088F2872|nr:HAMP domain-containing sensor histidine kinase [Quadrisphaera sp. DSM 44207]SDQ23811.1 two-component system, OmpR family, sensor kinase [Quadrisphaera sp. DSM 44207]
MRRVLHPARWTLRRRLLAGVLALLAAVSAVIGVVSVVALERELLDRVDDQLTAVVDRSRNAFDRPPAAGFPNGTLDDAGGPPADLGLRFLLAPGQGSGTLGALVQDGAVQRAAVLDRSGELQALTEAQATTLTAVPAGGEPRTVDLGDLGDYRLVAGEAPDGQVLVTGLALDDVQETVARVTTVVVLVAVLGLLAAAAVGAWVVREALRPLNRVAATASRVAELPLDRGEVALAVRVPPQDTDPSTEVGQVGAALNRMLEHVAAALSARHASESRVRQFVADASHELRTPLAAIRGYAELTRRGHHDLPADVTHAVGRVESEARRMTSLVEDLLLLARLDAGPAIHHGPVDLTRVVVDAVSDAHVTGPDHRWDLHVPPEPVVVDGDAARLHQVVTNLLANARVHTPPGTRVTAALEVRGPEAVLTVTDDGPGIPPDLLPRVFGRFARGDSSRSRAAGSTGLGLAIVAAVVEAHGGRVDVQSRPGRTAFTVALPACRTP